jgi:hypothetical protein
MMHEAVTQPRSKRRVFMWVFLAIQLLFLAWIVAGAAHHSPPCSGDLSAGSCAAAHDVGNGVAVAIQFALWIAVDFILGVTWFVIRFARSHS